MKEIRVDWKLKPENRNQLIRLGEPYLKNIWASLRIAGTVDDANDDELVRVIYAGLFLSAY